MKRRLLAMALLLAVVLTAFAGCGAPKVPNKKQIIEDMEANGLNAFYLDEQDTYFEIDDFEIIKRRTEDTFDEVYIAVILEHDYYTIDAEYALYYNLYDVGGWVLDYSELTYGNITVKKSPYEEMLEEAFDAYTIEDRVVGFDKDGDYIEQVSFTGICEYNYSTVEIKGQLDFLFYNNEWFEEVAIESVSSDFSKMLGKWQYEHSETKDYFTLYLNKLIVSPTDGVVLSKYGNSITREYFTSAWRFLSSDSANDYTSKVDDGKIRDFTAETIDVLGEKVKIHDYYEESLIRLGDQNIGGYLKFDKDDGILLTYKENGESVTVNLTKK